MQQTCTRRLVGSLKGKKRRSTIPQVFRIYYGDEEKVSNVFQVVVVVSLQRERESQQVAATCLQNKNAAKLFNRHTPFRVMYKRAETCFNKVLISSKANETLIKKNQKIEGK